MSETPKPERLDVQREMRTREKFLQIAKGRAPMEFALAKGERAGETIRLVTEIKRTGSLEYRGFVGDKLIAVMYMNPPIGSLAQVTNSKVARDYRRSGLASRIYAEINSDLGQVGAKLEPHWGSMSPDAVRFWQDFGKDDVDMQKRLAKILEDMYSSGRVETYDAAKEDGETDWNGEYLGPDKHERMLGEWKQKGYMQVMHDLDNLAVFPPEIDPGLKPEKYEMIPIEGNEDKIVELMKKYE